MHIGVDLDNTVLDATTPHLYYFNQASGLSLTPEDVNDVYIYRLYGWNTQEMEVVYHQHGHDIHWHSTPFPHAVEVLVELAKDHQISIITARPMLFREVTERWLEQNGIRYHNIAFTENKLQECMNAGVDVLIDDAPHYAHDLTDRNIPVILYDQPYNHFVTKDLVYRAKNWLEVKRLLTEIEVKC